MSWALYSYSLYGLGTFDYGPSLPWPGLAMTSALYSCAGRKLFTPCIGLFVISFGYVLDWPLYGLHMGWAGHGLVWP
jgi:hypothetical protein